METPKQIEKDEPNYRPAAWQEYDLAELGWWIHLQAQRAGMRANAEKRAKDLDDAAAYLAMMQAHLDAAR